jgi:hypothetical protein
MRACKAKPASCFSNGKGAEAVATGAKPKARKPKPAHAIRIRAAMNPIKNCFIEVFAFSGGDDWGLTEEM